MTEIISLPENVVTKEISLLKEWKYFTLKYEWLHFKSHIYFKYMNYGIMIPIIILTSLSGSTNIILSSVKHEDCGNKNSINYPQLIIGFTTIIAAILTTIYNFMKVPELQQLHLTHSSDFNKLSREIEMELVLFETKHKTYSSLEEFIKNMRMRLDRFIESAPPIPNMVLKKIEESSFNGLETSFRHISKIPSFTYKNNNEVIIDVSDEQSINVEQHIPSTDDVIKNIENFKIQLKNDDFEKFKHNIKLRSL